MENPYDQKWGLSYSKSSYMRFSGSSSVLCWASGAAHGIPSLSMRQWARKILTDLILNLISDYLDVNTCIDVIAICPAGRSPKQQQFLELQDDRT